MTQAETLLFVSFFLSVVLNPKRNQQTASIIIFETQVDLYTNILNHIMPQIEKITDADRQTKSYCE